MNVWEGRLIAPKTLECLDLSLESAVDDWSESVIIYPRCWSTCSRQPAFIVLLGMEAVMARRTIVFDVERVCVCGEGHALSIISVCQGIR